MPILGVPVYTTVALTTFEEAKQIIDEFSAAGVKDIVVKFTGWLRGGVDHEFPNRIVVDGAIGGSALSGSSQTTSNSEASSCIPTSTSRLFLRLQTT